MAAADQRTQVLQRIREALRQPAPHRHVGQIGDHPALSDAKVEALPDAEAYRAWLPAVGTSLDEQIELFARNSAQLKTEFHRVTSLEAAAQQLADIARASGWQRIATHRHPLAQPVAESLGLPRLLVEPGYEVHEMERCDAAVTGCDFLVAQTGSLLVSGPSAGGRALSVLPPHHVVVARKDQIVPDLAAALRGARERYAAQWPSFLSFITGPSRTGDIERILVLGAHGPKRLTILLVD
jgi:L-lactate dehydrogenase complex protein LldG